MFGKKKLLRSIMDEKDKNNKLACLNSLIRWQISRNWCDKSLAELFFINKNHGRIQCNFELLKNVGGTKEQLFSKIEPILEEYYIGSIFIGTELFLTELSSTNSFRILKGKDIKQSWWSRVKTILVENQFIPFIVPSFVLIISFIIYIVSFIFL